MAAEIYTFLIFICVTIAIAEVEIITQPKPGQEYVFVQSSGSGARPITRKDKTDLQSFETSHKLPSSFTYTLKELVKESKIHKREASPEAPAPAPAGAIKLTVAQLLEKYKDELKTTTTPKVATSRRRTKKEVTSPSPILTTRGPLARRIENDDIPLVASGSEKQRSRIQVKKGPNGQDYEYEYVYYYYDDDEEGKEKVTNSHDGPARVRANPEKTSATPEANEILPKSRTRGRQLGEEEVVGEERLPANTRFPPRSRNLNTTPLPEEEAKTRGRGRGRPSTETAPEDNVSDETQGNRGRTRTNVRRPSLDLVDNASFNTYSNGAEPVSGGPSFPTDLPAGPVRFLGATPNESVDLPVFYPFGTIQRAETPLKPAIDPEETATSSPEITTFMSPMDKVALDLYAILQGTQKLSGEDNATEEESTDVAADNEITTLEPTTEPVETTSTTTTTTTTTTTPAPTTTTTTTEASILGRGKFKGRGGLRKTTHSSSSTTEATHENKPKSKFNRPSFGSRPRARTTPEPEETKEESKPSHSKPPNRRFGNTRSRSRTTAAPETEEASNSPSSSSRPSLTRPRSSFNLRTRGRTTTPAADSEAGNEASSSEVSSTTTRTRRIGTVGAIRPLRPGPRINLSRNRPGHTTSTTTEVTIEDHVTGDDSPQEEAKEEQPKEETSSATVDNSPLGRLKNRNRLNIQPKPKVAASAPVQVRRINPLLARRRLGQTPEPTSTSEAPQEATEAAVEEETEPSTSSSTTTTEEPRGLNKLLAGRRRLARPGLHH